MKLALRRRPTRLAAATATALVLGAGSVAYAAIPSADGVVSGCYAKNGGTLRVVDASAPCKTTEMSIAWNQKGQPGAQGPQGPQGPQGAKGEPGGLSTVHTGSGSATVTADTYSDVAGVQLPAGTYQIAGKGQVNNQQSSPAVVSCNVYAGGQHVDASTATVGDPSVTTISEYAALAFVGTVELTAPGRVHIECIDGAGNPGVSVSARLTATTVGAIGQ
jgi:hypothetical protein